MPHPFDLESNGLPLRHHVGPGGEGGGGFVYGDGQSDQVAAKRWEAPGGEPGEEHQQKWIEPNIHVHMCPVECFCSSTDGSQVYTLEAARLLAKGWCQR